MNGTPKRPRDTNQLAKAVVDIATGQAPDAPEPANPAKRAAGRKGRRGPRVQPFPGEAQRDRGRGRLGALGNGAGPMTGCADRLPEPMMGILADILNSVDYLHKSKIDSWTRQPHERRTIQELKATGFIGYWSRIPAACKSDPVLRAPAGFARHGIGPDHPSPNMARIVSIMMNIRSGRSSRLRNPRRWWCRSA